MNHYLDAFKKYATFTGRTSRRGYWTFALIHMVILLGIVGAAAALDMPLLMSLYVIYAFGSMIPALAIGVRRMHDVGKSGWYLLIPIYSLILALTPGQLGSNQWGPDPKGAEGFATDETLLDN